MNSILFIGAVEGGLAERLKSMLWVAYGKPIKIILCIGLVVIVIGPLIAFIRRLIR